MPHENILDPSRTALAVIDVQESFRPHIPDFAEVAARCALVAHAARLLGLAVVVTEQYPKGLGRTAAEIAAVMPEGFEPVEKTAFSSCGARGDAVGQDVHRVAAREQVVRGLIDADVRLDAAQEDLPRARRFEPRDEA